MIGISPRLIQGLLKLGGKVSGWAKAFNRKTQVIKKVKLNISRVKRSCLSTVKNNPLSKTRVAPTPTTNNHLSVKAVVSPSEKEFDSGKIIFSDQRQDMAEGQNKPSIRSSPRDSATSSAFDDDRQSLLRTSGGAWEEASDSGIEDGDNFSDTGSTFDVDRPSSSVFSESGWETGSDQGVDGLDSLSDLPFQGHQVDLDGNDQSSQSEGKKSNFEKMDNLFEEYCPRLGKYEVRFEVLYEKLPTILSELEDELGTVKDIYKPDFFLKALEGICLDKKKTIDVLSDLFEFEREIEKIDEFLIRDKEKQDIFFLLNKYQILIQTVGSLVMASKEQEITHILKEIGSSGRHRIIRTLSRPVSALRQRWSRYQ